MKSKHATVRLYCPGLVLCFLAVSAAAGAQEVTTHTEAQKPAAQKAAAEPAPATPDPAPATPDPQTSSRAHVLFSRSTDGDNASDVAPKGDATAPGPPALRLRDPALAKAADQERSAITFTAYDLDIRIFAHQQSLAVRARVTLRNDSGAPLDHVRLQLSSTLHWERILIAGKPAAFKSETLPSDADHTGRVSEAVILLPTPLRAGETVTVDAVYSGQIPMSVQRLEDIGTPTDIAQRSDWDQVSDDLVALRGFGDVLWYPASAVPVALGDGQKYFTELGHQKQRQALATFQANVTGEFVGEPPNLAVINGQIEPVTVMAAPSDSYPGVVTASFAKSAVGFAAPSLFLLRRKEVDADDLQIYATDRNSSAGADYVAAAALAAPLIHEWLGGRPRRPLALVDLPEAADAPFEAGAALFTSLVPAQSADSRAPESPEAEATERLAHTLAHALSHAYFQSPRPWLDEGVAHFLAGEWLAQVKGREAALEASESQRNALALAEPASPGEGRGQSLIQASDPIYYRTKAAYVLGMLRDMVGESALSAALRAYVAAEDTRAEYFEGLVEKASRAERSNDSGAGSGTGAGSGAGSGTGSAGTPKDLHWFFDSWVYRDEGLPDLAIARVFPSRLAEPGQYLITVDIANEGYSEAEVPLTVRSKDAEVTERVRVPAHGRMTHRILLRGAPTVVELNDGSVPEVVAAVHRQTISMTAPN